LNPVARGRVIAAHGRHYVVGAASGERIVCFTRGKKSNAACGDLVDYEPTGPGQGVIAAIVPRRNLLSRSNGFRTKLLAANLDAITIVVATSRPRASRSRRASSSTRSTAPSVATRRARRSRRMRPWATRSTKRRSASIPRRAPRSSRRR